MLVIISELAIQDLDQYMNSLPVIKEAEREEDIKREDMKEEDIKYILAQIVIAISFLHENRITHRDLKPENVLMFPNLKIKISDFGLAKLVEQSKASFTKGCGTRRFGAPEVMGTVRNAKPDIFKTDIWSLGMTACYMMLKNVPDL